MDLLITAGKTILAYIILMLLGTNLLGMSIRGLVTSYKKNEQGGLGVVENVRSTTSILMTTVFILITVVYYYILYTNWNLFMVLAAAMLMFSGLPDVLFEMRTGESVSKQNMPKRPIDIICSIIYWLALPVVWLAFTT